MDASVFHPYLGTLWTESGESVLRLSGSDAEIRVTAPPRDDHAVTASSRILRVDCAEGGHVLIWLSHR
jgi:hypothetical protein